MNTYSVSVEGMVQRTIFVEAATPEDAKDLAKDEFCSLVGAEYGDKGIQAEVEL